jgi:hypothetical protein
MNELFLINVSNMQFCSHVNFGSLLTLGKKIKNQKSFKQHTESNPC